MATYAIGDVQGCYDELRRLLDAVGFDPSHDRLWFAGDMVNRGPKSLAVLRFVKGLGGAAVSVLGNHDLHLLALSQGNRKHYRHGSLDEILTAPDHDELIDWIRHRPLLYRDPRLGFTLVHAGLPPQWDVATARMRAAEVETALRGADFSEFCHHMYGNEPAVWRDSHTGWDRLRYIVNCFSRLRYCDVDGRLAFKDKGPPGTQGPSLMPWFLVPERASRAERIVFGHWSTLGFHMQDNVYAVDSGCLWGGHLTALRLDDGPQPFHLPCAGVLPPRGL